jgi:hypothetical protein
MATGDPKGWRCLEKWTFPKILKSEQGELSMSLRLLVHQSLATIKP